MPVSRRDIESAVTDLIDLISTEKDTRTRLDLLEYAADLMTETLGPASDRAVYELRLSLPSIAETVYESGWKTWRVKAAIRRHCDYHGIPTPNERTDVRSYVPIM